MPVVGKQALCGKMSCRLSKQRSPPTLKQLSNQAPFSQRRVKGTALAQQQRMMFSCLRNMKCLGREPMLQRRSRTILNNTAITLRGIARLNISTMLRAMLPCGGSVLPIPPTPTISVLSAQTATAAIPTATILVACPHVSRYNIWNTFVLIALSKTPCVVK